MEFIRKNLGTIALVATAAYVLYLLIVSAIISGHVNKILHNTITSRRYTVIQQDNLEYSSDYIEQSGNNIILYNALIGDSEKPESVVVVSPPYVVIDNNSR
jgi:cell division protein FtsX